VKKLLERLRAAFDNLAPRERMLTSAVGLVLAICIAYFGILLPLLDAGSRIEQRVTTAEQQLGLVKRLRREFDDVNYRLTDVEQRIQTGARGNLRTTLEDLAQLASVKVESMEPQSSPADDRYRETKVEVALKQVTLPQTVNYLHRIESTEQALSVKALRIRSRSDKPQFLDVTFTVSSFEPL
jgi:type II secretory pathway component PulM